MVIGGPSPGTKLFGCTCTLEVKQGSPEEAHERATDFIDLRDGNPDLHGVSFLREGRAPQVILDLEAADVEAARRRGKELLGRIVAGVNRKWKKGAIAAGPVKVEPAPELPPELMSQLEEAYAIGKRVAEKGSDDPDPRELPPLEDPWAQMRVQGTNGDNSGVDTETIVRSLKEWQALADFSIVSVGPAHVTVVFSRLPEDLEEFTAAAYRLCPDLDEDVPELVESEDEELTDEQCVRAIARQLQEQKVLRLWWD